MLDFVYTPILSDIVDMGCGFRHTAVLDTAGRAYTFGDDRKIQLGLGDTRSISSEDRRLPFNLKDDFNTAYAPGIGDSEKSFGYLQGMEGKVQKALERNAVYSVYDRHEQRIPREVLMPRELRESRVNGGVE